MNAIIIINEVHDHFNSSTKPANLNTAIISQVIWR